jgi:hypothetical protein
MDFVDFLCFKENIPSEGNCYKNVVIIEAVRGSRTKVVQNGKRRRMWPLVMTVEVTSHADSDKLSPITSSLQKKVTILMSSKNVSPDEMRDIITEGLTTVMVGEKCTFPENEPEEEEDS